MMGILQVASYIYKRYMDDFGVRIDEMKLHKLLYFTQRECLIQKGEPMFEALFEAWKYGPVMVQIRQYYKNDWFFSNFGTFMYLSLRRPLSAKEKSMLFHP